MLTQDQIKTAAITTLTQYMRKHRLRKTPERFAVLEKVMEMNDHFLIDTLCTMLADSNLKVSRATVYHTMDLLIDAGLVRRHTFGGTPTKYENITGTVNHHHIVCTVCGGVNEFSDHEIDTILASRKFRDFRPGYIDLYVYGICSRCMRHQKKQTVDE